MEKTIIITIGVSEYMDFFLQWYTAVALQDVKKQDDIEKDLREIWANRMHWEREAIETLCSTCFQSKPVF